MNKYFIFFGSILICFITYLLITNFFLSKISESEINPFVASENNYVMVYFGSSNCQYSNDERIPKAINEIQKKLQAKSDAENMKFNSVGVSIDWDLKDGLNHLDKSGDFNEIMVGNNWFNHGSLKYFFQDSLTTPGTPQVLILKRSYSLNENGSLRTGANHANLVSDSLIVRLAGVESIIGWNDKKEVESGKTIGE